MLGGIVAGSVAAATAWLIMIFVLFFFLRDRTRVLATVTRFLPLTGAEAGELFKVTADTVHATVYGTLGVALLQGTLGGLMFWWLGLPAPLLWGAVMAVLSVLPVLGAALVWVPAAAYLALSGEWTDAIILSAFGIVVIGLVDNLVYPLIVKGRIRLHAVPVFIAILGGLIVFGASGIVLGPLLLALTDELVTLWRRHLGLAPAGGGGRRAAGSGRAPTTSPDARGLARDADDHARRLEDRERRNARREAERARARLGDDGDDREGRRRRSRPRR